ncbi:MAG TPA: hypothetical protein VFO76_00830 [Candidatus Kapabacteria bacterium]|nr:hypothetical protein [Candidatus Kapabacteria bacterium]
MNSPTADKQLNALKLICFVLPTGAGLFTIIAFFLGPDSSSFATDPTILRIVLLAMAVALFSVQRLLRKKLLSGNQAMRSGDNTFINRYYTASLVQLATTEGVALFSAVILIQIPPSVKAIDPISYLHLLPLFWLVLVARSVYPSTEKIEALQQYYQPAS